MTLVEVKHDFFTILQFCFHGDKGRNWTFVSPPKRGVIRRYTTESKKSQSNRPQLVYNRNFNLSALLLRQASNSDFYRLLLTIKLPEMTGGQGRGRTFISPIKGCVLISIRRPARLRSWMELNHRFSVLAEQTPYFILATEPFSLQNNYTTEIRFVQPFLSESYFGQT